MFGRKKSSVSGPVRIDNPLLVAVRDSDPDGPMTVRIDVAQISNAHEAGLILADFAKHFAKALTATGKAASEEAAMTELRWMFDAEMNQPTDGAQGGVVQ